MKKLYVLLMTALCSCATFAYDFKVFPGSFLTSASPDGKYLASTTDGNTIIYNVWTGELYQYDMNEATTEYYTIGGGNAFNTHDMIVGAVSNFEPAVWYDGTWTKLPIPENTPKGTYSMAHAVSADGNTIVGCIATGSMQEATSRTVYLPAIWQRSADGTFDSYEILPYPKTDFTGRSPQYVTAVWCSADGTRAAGQIRSYNGFANYPVVYTKGADGKWTYKIYGLDEIVKPGPDFPEWPKNEPKEPKVDDYLTAADKEAYNEAMNKYRDSLDMYNQQLIDKYPSYPYPEDFMSEDKRAEYEKAGQEYMDKYTMYQDSVNNFNSVYQQRVTDHSFTYNAISLSSNGRFLVQTLETPDPYSSPEFGGQGYYTPVVFDIDNEGAMTKVETDSMIGSTITDDGTLFAGSPAIDYSRNAYVVPAGQTKPVKLQKWLAEKCDTAAKWLKENMSFTVSTYSYDADGQLIEKVVEDSLVSGTVSTNADGTIIVGYVYDMWNEDSQGYTSYIINIVDPDNSTAAIDSHHTGATPQGQPIATEYYSATGQRIARPIKGQMVIKKTIYAGKATKTEKMIEGK